MEPTIATGPGAGDTPTAAVLHTRRKREPSGTAAHRRRGRGGARPRPPGRHRAPAVILAAGRHLGRTRRPGPGCPRAAAARDDRPRARAPRDVPPALRP